MTDFVLNKLNTVKEETSQNTSRSNISHISKVDQLANSLHELFPEQEYEDKAAKQAKEILGNTYSNQDISDIVTSFEFLIDNWLDEYERKVFNNKTLEELLQGL